MPPKTLSASCSYSIAEEHDSHSIANELDVNSFDAQTETSMKETRLRHNEKLRRLVEEMGKIPVTFRKSDGRPSGKYASTFMTELGIVIRSFALLQVQGRKHITIAQKKPMFDRLQSAFAVDFSKGSDSIESEVEQLMKECYRNNRARMHAFYKKNSSKPWEERLVTLPKTYCEEQSDWEFMCKMFESNEFKIKSKVNKENRSKQKYNHRGGSKSFVQHSYECGNGPTEVDRIVLFKKTRYNEKNGWVDGAESVYNELVERRNEYQREYKDVNSFGGQTGPMDEMEIASRVCDDILKSRSGYIRGLGNGPKPSKSSVSDASSRRATNIELKNELASTKEELETTRVSLHAAEEKIVKLEETVHANQKMMMQVFERIAPDILHSLMEKSSCSAPPNSSS